MGRLDINKLKTGFEYISIGKLTKKIIELLDLNMQECEIGMFEDRFKYVEKHKNDFSCEEEFWEYIANIPEVISNPDYIAVHPTKNSIEFIKKYNELLLVAVRIKKGSKIYLRTVYPITQKQLDSYIQSGTATKL